MVDRNQTNPTHLLACSANSAFAPSAGETNAAKRLMIRSKACPKRKKRDLLRKLVVALTLATTVPSTAGCRVWNVLDDGPLDTTTSYHDTDQLSIEYPEVAECATPVTIAARAAEKPLSLEDPSKLPALELSLEQAVQMAMQNSPVIRTLPVFTVLNAANAQTVYDPAITASSNQGAEAALSFFDAQYTTSGKPHRASRA